MGESALSTLREKSPLFSVKNNLEKQISALKHVFQLLFLSTESQSIAYFFLCCFYDIVWLSSESGA